MYYLKVGLKMLKVVKWSRASLLFVVFAALSACGGGGGSVADTTSPIFSGISLVAPASSSQVTLTWQAASDNTTTASAIEYDIHVSEQADFTPDVSTLNTTVTGQTQATITGLIGGNTYYFKVVANDASGNITTSSTQAITLPVSDSVLNTAETVVAVEDLNLGAPTVLGTQYTYDVTATSTPPNVDDVIVGETADGSYLRRVVSVTEVNGQYVIETSDAALSEIVSQGTLASSVTLTEPASTTTSGAVIAGVMQQFLSEDVTQANGVSYSPATDTYLISMGEAANPDVVAGALTGSTEGAITVGVSMDFAPTIKTNLQWSGASITSGEVIMDGELSLVTSLNANFSAAASYTKNVKLFSRSFLARYLLAGVPVWQKVTLSVVADINAAANSEIDAGVTNTDSISIRLGVRHNSSTGNWDYVVTDPAFNSKLETNLDINGSVTATVKLIPKLTTEFYSVVSSNFSFVPLLKGIINADNVDLPTGVPVALKQFKVITKGTCNVDVNLSVLHLNYQVLPKTQVCATPTYTLFDLPKVTLESNNVAAGEYEVSATTEDGANNPLDVSSIEWFSETGTFSNNTGVKITSFYPDTDGSHDVYFSSTTNALGEVGRTYHKISTALTGTAQWHYAGTTETGLTVQMWPVNDGTTGVRGTKVGFIRLTGPSTWYSLNLYSNSKSGATTLAELANIYKNEITNDTHAITILTYGPFYSSDLQENGVSWCIDPDTGLPLSIPSGSLNLSLSADGSKLNGSFSFHMSALKDGTCDPNNTIGIVTGSFSYPIAAAGQAVDVVQP